MQTTKRPECSVKAPHAPKKKKVTIDALLRWVYVDQMADRAGVRRDFALGYGVSMSAQAAQMAALGCRVDGAAGVNKVHADAAAVHDAVCSLRLGYLLIEYAKAGAVPDPMLGAQARYRVALNAHEKPKRIYDRNRKLIGTVVECESSLAMIEEKKERFEAWEYMRYLLAQSLAESDVLIAHELVWDGRLKAPLTKNVI